MHTQCASGGYDYAPVLCVVVRIAWTELGAVAIVVVAVSYCRMLRTAFSAAVTTVWVGLKTANWCRVDSDSVGRLLCCS